MTLTDAEREHLAARARTLRERLSNPPEDPDETVDAERWMDKWCEHLADGDEELFAERLEVAGYSAAECRRRLSRGGWPRETPLPDWVDRVDDVLGYVDEEVPDDPPTDPMGADEQPFAHLLVAVVEYAAEQVDWSALPDAISDPAADALERHLLQRLSRIARHPLFIEFKTFLAERDRELALADDPAVPDPPARHYEAFVGDLLAGGLTDVLVEYPVLAKLLAGLVEMWVDAVEEFGAHLAADLPDVAEELCDADDPGPVVDVEARGDVHHSGRRVLGLAFESGDRVAYKPRNVDVEARYSAVVEWLNEHSTVPTLRTLQRLDRDDHGWVEWVEPTACDSEAAVAAYYRRAGALICLTYALNFADGNLENVLAEGDQPVVVDLETLLQPRMAPEATTATETVADVFENSVLRTYLLPMFLPERDIQKVNGFGSAEAEVSEIERPEFSNVNTDAMDMAFVDTDVIEAENLPRLDGDLVPPEEYLAEITDGFESVYRLLADEREALLCEDGLLATFEDAEIRYIYRPSMTYAKVLVPLETPSYLRSGLAFSTKVERLARPFFDGRTTRDVWPVFEAERESLWQFDVPRFTVDATGTALTWDGGSVDGSFVTTPLAAARERLDSLGPSDLAEQRAYLELAYEPERFSHPDPSATPLAGQAGSGATTGDPRTADAEVDLEALALRAARGVFERLRDADVRTPDDDPFWVVREYRVDGVYFPRVPDNFYSGRPGIATFAAALGRVLDDDTYRDYAREVVEPSYERLGEIDPVAEMKVGLSLGYGGLVYGYVKLWELLDDDRFLDAARQCALRTDREMLDTDEHLDPHRGTSGLLVALLSVYGATGDDAVLDRAVLAGDHLLDHRTGTTGLDLWRRVDEDGDRLSVNHGADALAYSLFGLADATGADRFRAAAREGLEYDVTGQDRDPCPDVRIQHREQVTPSWCDGRVGLGISRLALHEATGEAALRQEAERVVRGLDADRLDPWDNVYSGTFARVELLRRAARTLGNPSYRDAARETTRAAVRRADAASRFSVPWQTDDWYNPGFHTGETGVGYALLRWVDPSLPNVLFWE